MKQELGVGVVGVGFLARTRARCWARVHGVDARIVAVAGRNEQRAREFAGELVRESAPERGLPAVERSAQVLCSREDIQLIDLCVPNHLHRPFAELAARAGKHVVCTKPLAAYVGQDLVAEGADATDVDAETVGQRDRRAMARVAIADAQAMVAATRAAGVQLYYGENWLYAPSLVRARELAAESRGVALELRGWEAHSGSHSPYSRQWKFTGGGALLRLAAHPIGAMLAWKHAEGLRLSGEPVRVASVSAEVGDPTRHPALDEVNTRIATGWHDVESWGQAVLTFSDGTRGIAHGSDLVLGGMQSRLEVAASDAFYRASLSPNDMLSTYAPDGAAFGNAYVMEKIHGASGWTTPMPDEDFTSGHQGMIQAFAVAAAQGRPAEADGELGLEVTRVVYAAYISASEGRRVRLAELERPPG